MDKLAKTLHKEFEAFLLNKFVVDRRGKHNVGETHRWFFCRPVDSDFADGPYDCACCISGNIADPCGCDCHFRIAQIEKFILKFIERRKNGKV